MVGRDRWVGWRMAIGFLGCAWAGIGMASVSSRALDQAVSAGARIFNNDSFGSTVRPVENASRAFAMAGTDVKPVGSPFLTCATCHINGGRTRGLLEDGRRFASLRNAAAVFPRYNVKLHRTMTLTAQIRHCVRAGIVGRPPAYTSAAMVDLVSYLTSLATGVPMAIGGPTR